MSNHRVKYKYVLTNLATFPVGRLNMEPLESRGTEYGDVPGERYHG